MQRTVDQVARNHLRAVESGDPQAMAADYASHAVLERADDRFVGHAAIAAYFATVPERLGDAHVVFDALEIDGEQATFRWHLEGSNTTASGIDTCTITDGAIVHQIVRLVSTDF